MRKEIIRRIKLRECTHVKALKGMGATTLLKSLPGVYAESRPLKPIVMALARESKGTIQELKNLIKCEKEVLLLDDSQLITKQIKNFVEKLLNQGLVLVSVGSRNVFRLHELELKPLCFKESVNLVNKHLRNKELSKVIVGEVGGNPSLLMNAVRKARARKDLRTLKGFKEFKKSVNQSVKRKELINPVLLSALSALLISLRYLFYIQREFKTGYTVAMIAYALITIGRVGKMRKT